MGADYGWGARGAEDAMVATLLEFHRRKRQATNQDPRGAHGRILDHFDRRGQRLRGERLITSELIERLFGARAALPSPRPQQELEIWGPAGATAAGRVRLTNRSHAKASFDLVVGEPDQGTRPSAIRFEPARGALEANETVLVRVEASLIGWEPGQRATLPVECRWREGTDRVWLVIAAQTGGSLVP